MVVGDQHRDAAAAQVVDDAHDLAAALGVDAGEGLVEEHQLGLYHQSAGDLKAAALAAGKAGGAGIAQMGEAEFAEQLVEAGGALLQRAVLLEYNVDVVGNAEPCEHRRFLGEVAHAEAGPGIHRQAGHLLLAEDDRTSVRTVQSDHHAEGRALPGTIGAEQADDLAGQHIHAETLHHGAGAEAFREPFDAEKWHCGKLVRSGLGLAVRAA